MEISVGKKLVKKENRMNEMKERMRTEKSYFSKRSIIFIGIS